MKVLWTDGSADPNPGKGGFAVIEVVGKRGRPVILGSEDVSTNIRMEGMALIKAMEYAGEEGCVINTDSQFWINVLTKWAPSWEKREWHKAADEIRNDRGDIIAWKESSIKNLDLVKRAYELYCMYPVELAWVRGHIGARFNEMADRWAHRARRGAMLV